MRKHDKHAAATRKEGATSGATLASLTSVQRRRRLPAERERLGDGSSWRSGGRSLDWATAMQQARREPCRTGSAYPAACGLHKVLLPLEGGACVRTCVPAAQSLGSACGVKGAGPSEPRWS